MATSDVRAPSVVQNLNLASDLYGDRSNINVLYDSGVQLYSYAGGGAGKSFVPIRTQNTHLLAGESELRPDVGCDYPATFADTSFLPRGFASDQLFFAVTSLGISIVQFGRVAAALNGGNKMSTAQINADLVAQGTDAAAFTSAPGAVANAVFRSTFSLAYSEYRSDGRKCSFVLPWMLGMSSGSGLNDATSLGFPMPGNKQSNPVPFLLSPRNTNQSQEIFVVNFTAPNETAAIDTLAPAAGTYALKYNLLFSGYFCDEQGVPAMQNFSRATAAAASEYRVIGG